jgi:purine-nucleoside phosphorylase
MATLEDGIVRPICNQDTPVLGPLAIIAATSPDFHFLQQKLSLPETRTLFFSTINYDASDSTAPTLVGPFMGAPYAVMLLETLHAWGVRTIFFVGWCGSITSRFCNGDILLPDSAVVDEGTSLHYGQHTGAIVRPDDRLLEGLQKEIGRMDIAYGSGRVWTTDGVFRETPRQIKKYKALGAVAVEMELSALFSTAQYYRLSMAALLVVSDELFSLQWRPGFKEKRFQRSRKTVCEFLWNMVGSMNHD